jgi:predicted Zn-dependent protease
MPVPTHLILRAAFCLSAVFAAAGCSSSDARARDALNAYQTALAANDMVGARRELLKLVRTKDDVADYWSELGRVEAALGQLGDAAYAYSRAYELDRSNPNLLRSVVEYALRSGNMDLAKARVKELEVVLPDDPWVKITRGWMAIGDLRYDEALGISNNLLATSPFDSGANIIKARALLGLNREDEAIDVLTKHIQAQPSDAGSLELLARIYVRRGDWARATDASRRLNAIPPFNRNNGLMLAEAAFRSGNVAIGRAASSRLLKPNVKPNDIWPVLDIWTNYWQSPQRLEDARTFALSAAGPQQRLVYAAFLSRQGSPADAVRFAAPDAILPVRADNAEANAVLADALFRLGKLADAKSRFDAVIAFDPGNATALRGRSELELKTGDSGAAVLDAQKLVTVDPYSADDRLLLAHILASAGKADWADRTLWEAFQAIPGNEKIFAALQASKKSNIDATRELQDEFDRQRDTTLGRGIL